MNPGLAMALGERLGGHIVQGHVDGVGQVLGRSPEGRAEIWSFAAPESMLRYTVEKSSICVDGINLTLQDLRNKRGVLLLEHGIYEAGLLPVPAE